MNYSRCNLLDKFDKKKLLTELEKRKNRNVELDSETDESGDDSDLNEQSDQDDLFILEKIPNSETNVQVDHIKGSSGKSEEKSSIGTLSSLDTGWLQLDDITVSSSHQDEKNDQILKKSVVIPGFEKLTSVPAYKESSRLIKKRRREERSKTTGKDWFDLPAAEVTEEVKNDLMILKMRNALDPKYFYKSNDRKVLPKFFQVGKVMDNAADFYHSRIPKKQRKRTLVDELMADAQFQQFKKRKLAEVYSARDRTRKAYRELKTKKKQKVPEDETQ